MGLYLCIFDEDRELDGVEVGFYDDFDAFRTCVRRCVEGGEWGDGFPTLMLHVDSDGEWSPEECVKLKDELEAIREHFQRLPAVPFNSDWKAEAAKKLGLTTSTAFDCFFDVDGEPLLDRLIGLAELAIRTNRPILFQ